MLGQSLNAKIEKSLIKMKDQGFKYTKKRESMLTYLVTSNRYLSAREIHDFMKQNYKGISFDTIYRNLQDFEELELIEVTELFGEKKFRFTCCEDIGHHHHFICMKCGKTKEIHMCPMDFFQEQLKNCTIEGHRFDIFGYCELCTKSIKDQ